MKGNEVYELDFQVQIDELLNSTFGSRKSGANLCLELCEQRVRVLPKAQPPVNGLSTRSLTSYIAICPPSHLEVNWKLYHRGNVVGSNERICNMLLIPWPFEVHPSQFRECNVAGTHERIGWFIYSPDTSENLPLIAVERLVNQAENTLGRPDLVVMPETSMTLTQYELVKNFLARRDIGLIAGVCSPGDQVQPFGKNVAMMSFPEPEEIDFVELWQQYKHHRWKIDASQIENYGIATQLNPQKCWWEGICVEKRSLSFFVLREWLCSCVMICEDLARIDPAGQLVRAVAPDLVIALLFDGPQLATRWPAYHATVLADDPGSSVLTLSCLGMTRLSRPVNFQHLKDSSTVIGMWRDPRRGQVQIELPPGKTAAMLTVARYKQTCETADGRSNLSLDGAPKFASLNYL
ncbi:MAG: hypothetical protein Q8M16_01530 [Pirellulaceae bacterium]|nr:hypothetical protein [Pirellulaceae bacterium]